MVHIWCDAPSANTFVFKFSAGISTTFNFDRPLLSLSENRCKGPFKRRRALSDVDGGAHQGKKKRRLRLDLITSRLSRPFSAPATNIVNRGSSKIAVWAKNKALGRNMLRKAAIMNSVRMRVDEAKEMQRRASEDLGQETLLIRQVLPQRSWSHDTPLPPSPLGLSNYDALDLEDEVLDDGDESQAQIPGIYSDFNIMNPVSGEGDDYDYLDELDGIPHDLPEDRAPPAIHDERIVEILREKERQREVCFVQLGH